MRPRLISNTFIIIIAIWLLENSTILRPPPKKKLPDVKLGKYTVPTGNRTRGRRVAVHYATDVLLKVGCIIE